MAEFPHTLEAAIAQAQSATQAALAAGYTRLSVELLIPELKPMAPAYQYLPMFADLGQHLKIFFTDAGAAALARREWADLPYSIQSVDVAGSRQTTPVEALVEPEDRAFLLIAPSSVEVYLVEQICLAAGDRPVILFNPRLEDIGTVGIGYAARELRKRFLNTIEPCYFLRPMDPIVLLRNYPQPWQIWLEKQDTHELIGEELLKPDSEKLDAIVRNALGAQAPAGRSFISQIQQIFKALGQ